ncbi:MAG TPA: hypothetical protein VK742_03925 [Candidatus Sulfotelmatobacter sp.]|nr:hypothetical protein [Candidatus Sulfotelmatobacter sp.]
MSVLEEPKIAWLPVTPRGVAAFARASVERLLVVQAAVALLAAAVVTWVLANGFFPTIDQAVGCLPKKADITHGQLNWPDTTPEVLAQGHFLSFSVDLQHSGTLRLPAQFQFEFGGDSIVIISLLGEMEVPYPPDRSFYLDRPDVQPAWGAWSPDFLGLAAVGTFFGLLLSWWLLTTLYFLPVWLVGFFTDRDLRPRAAWKMAGAALMPGALLFILGLWLYGLAMFDLVRLAFAFTMHLVIGWIYLFVSPMFLNRVTAKEKANPFASKN